MKGFLEGKEEMMKETFCIRKAKREKKIEWERKRNKEREKEAKKTEIDRKRDN